MTRGRTLKHAIRERAARTGERYSAARRHILAAAAPAAALPLAPRGGPAAAPPKGSVSDATSLEKTGHRLDYWFAVLDRFGAIEKRHTLAARHLRLDHQVPAWYAQGITVAYERARGVRVLNQRFDGEFQVSVSKVIPAESRAVIKAFTDVRTRKRWLDAADPQLAAALTAAFAGRSSKGFVVRADGQARSRYKWGATIVEVQVLPKPGGKVTLSIQHTKLAGADAVEARRSEWRTAVNAIGALFRN